MRQTMNTTPPTPHLDAATPQPTSPQGAICVESLFAGAREVTLTYREQDYRLRITRNSKLILTK